MGVEHDALIIVYGWLYDNDQKQMQALEGSWPPLIYWYHRRMGHWAWQATQFGDYSLWVTHNTNHVSHFSSTNKNETWRVIKTN
jgi:G:T/U-mismatch repair DNA glycosylase